MAFENLKKNGITYLLGKLKDWCEDTFAKISNTVFSVNGTGPDENGDVAVERVNLAGNLETSFKQNSTGAFLQRTTGGNAAIVNGLSYLTSVMGNIVHEDHVDAIVNMTVTPAGEEDPISATIDKTVFIESIPFSDRDQSATIALTYSTSTGWSADPATYGVTIIGTETDGDAIVIDYTPEIRGTIILTTPNKFVSTGWNLYDPANEYAKVVRYSNEYGYMVRGAYSALYFATTPTGVATQISVASDGSFTIPSDGYVMVTGGNPSSTAIFATWSDWTNGYPGSFEEYSASEIDFSSVVGEGKFFSYGMCAVGSVRDEINLSTGKAYRRIERLEYNETNMNTAKTSGRPYIYDSDYIYIVQSGASSQSITILSTFTASDHGIEYFTDSDVPAYAQASYNMNLKNKLERDTVTISQQTLSANEQTQIRTNIGAVSQSEMNAAVATLNGSILVRKYSYYISSLASGASLGVTAANFGITNIEGYTPVMALLASTGYSLLACYALAPVLTGTVMGIRNMHSSAATKKTCSVYIVWVKNQLVGA